nr:hypothetical protein BCU19_05875 [Vibrio cyclitrophicus]
MSKYSSATNAQNIIYDANKILGELSQCVDRTNYVKFVNAPWVHGAFTLEHRLAISNLRVVRELILFFVLKD